MAIATSQYAPIIMADKTVTITAGQTVSSSADLLGTVVIALLTEDTMAVATSITFEASVDGVSFFPAFNDASVPLAVSIQENRYIALDIVDFASIRFIKVVLDTIEAGDVTITLISRPSL